MERLTRRNEQNTGYYYPKCFEKCDGMGTSDKCNSCNITSDICDKLGQYEDAEEQGLILRLPTRDVFESCGDTVYYIFDYEIVECINCGVSIDCDRKLWIALAYHEKIFPYRTPMAGIDTDPTDWCTDSTEVSVDEFGKTVFLTKEEAEQKLKN